MALSVVTAPASTPVDLPVAKDHLRVTTSDNDAQITALISTARNFVEEFLNRTLITTTLKYSMDKFCKIIELPLSPVQTITTVKYVDQNGTLQTLAPAEYQVDLESVPSRVMPAFGKTWPSIQGGFNQVQIEYVAGYGDVPADIPDSIKHAILLLLAHWYENREAILTGSIQTSMDFTVAALLGPFRISAGV